MVPHLATWGCSRCGNQAVSDQHLSKGCEICWSRRTRQHALLGCAAGCRSSLSVVLCRSDKFTGTVSEIVSGDCLLVKDKASGGGWLRFLKCRANLLGESLGWGGTRARRRNCAGPRSDALPV